MLKTSNKTNINDPELLVDISESVFEELIASGKLVIEQIRGHNAASRKRIKQLLLKASSR